MDYFYKNPFELADKNVYKNEGELPNQFFNRHFLYVNATDNGKNNHNGNNVEGDDKADINAEERKNVKEIQQYQQYQESQQNQQPWSDSSDIRIVDSD